MDIFERIVQALENNPDDPILKFGNFNIEKDINSGQQGMVMQISNKISKRFALKFYKPTDIDPNILKESLDNFKKEVNILASLNHKNIVKIYTGGNAEWNEQENCWKVMEEFNADNQLLSNQVAYYIMDFIEGLDIDSIFPELRDPKDKKTIIEEFSLNERLILFEDMVTQVSKAMHYYHSIGFTHKDIKPKNIRFCKEDSTFVVVDFGFAHRIKSPQNRERIVRTDYFDFPSIDGDDYQKNDMGQLSLMLLKLLPSFKAEYHSKRYEGLKSAIEKGKHEVLKDRYSNMLEFYNSVKQNFLLESGWKFQLKLDEYMTPLRFGRFSSYLRIPVSGSILLTRQVRDIIDTPDFQRLRGVRQLGPTIFVFPGANHTRFEHSLGTYFLSLMYLKKLLTFPKFREICEPLDESIKLVVLSALLHDIGHYPYSHWIEEIDEFPGTKFSKHEERARKIIENSEIGELIKNKWGIDCDILSNIIAGKGLDDKNEMLNSILNSVIDVDKLDYLVRDSIHCGVNYGKGIDLERLLNSLYIINDTNKICLTEKGRSSLLSIISCRNIMYQEVYWHKTVRACDAMFKRFFYEYVSKRVESIAELKKSLHKSDDEFIHRLFENSKKDRPPKLSQLIKPFAFGGRTLIYKPAFIYFYHKVSEKNDTATFFEKLQEMSYKQMVQLTVRLTKKLKKIIPEIDPLDIIIEKAPVKEHERSPLEGFRIWNTRKKTIENHPSEIAYLNDYLKNNKQAYIFCNPDYYKDLKKMVGNKQLEKILGELI